MMCIYLLLGLKTLRMCTARECYVGVCICEWTQFTLAASSMILTGDMAFLY